ncbi:MAG TPA: hypothetical protein PKK06_14395 [Phycisphaerae bacterium]|nr:hypothetical protein [Phycisphaerae bacterium]HNU46304.1 hypothetical protein [Phycisphaerae bacterium]
MKIGLHPHARARLAEHGASEEDVIATVQAGERFPAKFGQTGLRRNFACNGTWHGKTHSTKQVEVIAVPEGGGLVLTVLVRFF